RIHAHGYVGHYIGESFGRGLVPETFHEYRKQRFRWTAGPVQELKMHWRWFLPRPFGRPSGMNGVDKFIELLHGLESATGPLAYAILPVAVVGALALALEGAYVPLPPAMLLFMAVGLVQKVAWSLLRSRLLGRSLGDSFRASIADRSLYHTKVIAVVTAFLS